MDQVCSRGEPPSLPPGAQRGAGIAPNIRPRIIGRPRKYPFTDLAVGEWFDMPLANRPAPSGRDLVSFRMQDAACRYARQSGKQFTVRTIRAEGVARCTRVE